MKKFFGRRRAGIVAVLVLVLLMGCSEPDLSSFAQCLTENELVMYSAFTCSHCARQKELFGDASTFLTEIECHPEGERSQTELCREKEISGTPTWILEPNGIEEERLTGVQSLKTLAEVSGCSLSQHFTKRDKK